jgi:predicted amidohydrolase
MPVIWGREKENIDRVMESIDDLPCGRVDMICLPELFTTGFDYDLLNGRDHVMTDEVLDALAGKARARSAYILAGTLPETDEGRVYNTLFVIDPSGKRIAYYRKMHLFPLMGEDGFFHPGETPLVFRTPEARIGVAVCYDLRFSSLFLKLALNGAQVIVVAAQFPAARIDHWDTLLRARAIENQLFVVGVNRTGEDPCNRFPGHSCIIDPLGKILAGGGEGEGWITGSIDIGEVDRVRRSLPALFSGGCGAQGHKDNDIVEHGEEGCL